MYSSKTDKRGRVMYFLDNKLISKNSIPEGSAVLDRDFDLEDQTIDLPQTQNDTLEAEAEPENRTCQICGESANRIRFINPRMVKLCDDHYQTMTVGEIAEALR